MAESVVNMEHENKIDEEEEEETREENPNLEGNTSHLLAGLNLVFILSFLSLSPEECSELEEINKEREVQNYNHKVNHVVSRSNAATRKRELNEFRGAERQTTPRDRTTIRDCRHSRRM